MKQYIILFLSALCLTTAFAQRNATDAHIVGDVKDAKTGEHIPFITITVKNTMIGTSTDATGHYFLKNLPVGKIVLVANSLGYKTVEKEVEIKSGETLEVNFITQEELISLNEIVVSANRNETNRKEASVIVGVLSPFVFEAVNSNSVSQGLSFQSGVRVENNCQNCGFMQVRINGLDGPYSQILIDSRPVFSALSGVYGLEQIPVNMIERVEVVRGGGSALFGSNAIAGTINIITREPLHNTFSVSNNFEYIGGAAPDNTLNVNTSLVTENQKAGIYLYGTNRKRSPFDSNDDGFSDITKISGNTFGFRSYFRLTNQSKITAEMHNMNEYRRGGDQLNLPPHQVEIAEEVKHDIMGGSIAYNYLSPDNKQRINVYTSLQNINRNSYYGSGQDPNAYGNTTNLTAVVGGQYVRSFDQMLFLPADLTAGSEIQHDALNDEMPGYGRFLHQKMQVLGVFLQNEWKEQRGSILLGGRADKHNMLDDIIFSPRINLKYNLTNNIHWRGSYSTGFRAPQAFDEDLHIAAVGGEVRLITVATDLRPERSNSVSTSFDFYFNREHFQSNLLIEGFYTHIDDVFVLADIGFDADGNIIAERHNGSGAKVMGVNVEGKIVPLSSLQLQFGYTFQRSRYVEAEAWSEDAAVAPEIRKLRTPDQYGYFTLAYNPTKKLTLNATGTYTGSMLMPHYKGYIAQDRLEVTPNFFDMGLKASYEFKLPNVLNLQLSGGVKNLLNSYQKDFDKGANRDAGYIYGPDMPRTFYISVKFGHF